MTKLQQAQSNYVNEIKRVQENAAKWRDFLDFAAQSNISDGMSGYEFSTKLIIHSVNPNAKDCRTFDDWKTADGNHVQRGEKGIPVLCRDSSGKQSVAHLFDTSQTALNKSPERIELSEAAKAQLKTALKKMTENYANNPALSDEQKRLFKATAEYKLSKQYGLETSENPEMFSGIDKLSVKEVANIGVMLNKCSIAFSAEIERSIENDTVRNNQQRDDRTEFYGRERNGMGVGRDGTGTRDEIHIRREAEPVVQSQRGELDIRTADRDTRTETHGGNGQVRQSAAEIHMADTLPDRSDNAEWERDKALRGNERESVGDDRQRSGENEAVSGIQSTGGIGSISSESADVGELQSTGGGANSSRDGLRNMSSETAETEKVSAVSDLREDKIEFHFGKGKDDDWISESKIMRDFALANPDCSFALGNAVIEYLDEKQHTERNIEGLNAGWYKKTDFEFTAIIDGEDFHYEGRFDIGDGKGTGGGSLIDHIRDYNQGIMNYSDYPYNTPESKEQAMNNLEILVPFLEKNSVLSEKEKGILAEFKNANPIRGYDDIEKEKPHKIQENSEEKITPDVPDKISIGDKFRNKTTGEISEVVTLTGALPWYTDDCTVKRESGGFEVTQNISKDKLLDSDRYEYIGNAELSAEKEVVSENVKSEIPDKITFEIFGGGKMIFRDEKMNDLAEISSDGIKYYTELSEKDKRTVSNRAKQLNETAKKDVQKAEFEAEPEGNQLSFFGDSSSPTAKENTKQENEKFAEGLFVGNVNRYSALYDEIMKGTGFQNGKFSVKQFYDEKKPDNEEFADFLKNSYGIGGHSGDGEISFVDHNSNGMFFTLESKEKFKFTWSEVAEMTAEIIDKGEYITQADIDKKVRSEQNAEKENHTLSEHSETPIKNQITATTLENLLTSQAHDNPIEQEQPKQQEIQQPDNSKKKSGEWFVHTSTDSEGVEYGSVARKIDDTAPISGKNMEYCSGLFSDDNEQGFNVEFARTVAEELNKNGIINIRAAEEYVNSRIADLDDFSDIDTKKIDLSANSEFINQVIQDVEKLQEKENQVSSQQSEQATDNSERVTVTHSEAETNTVEEAAKTLDIAAEKTDLPNQEQSFAEVTEEKPATYCYVLEHSQNNITLSTRYSEDTSIDDAVSTYLPIKFENSPNLQQVSVFKGESEAFVPYNWYKREDLFSKSKSFDLDGTYYLFESGKLFDKAGSNSSALDKISEAQREAAEKFAGSPVSLPEFSYIKGGEERIIDRSILQSREAAETIQQKEENPTLKTDYFRITDEHLGEGSKREKFRNNVNAIKTLKRIEDEERAAAPDEQETMSKYVGWGGLQEAFDKNDSAWEKEFHELKNLLSEEEYEAALATVNDAFYTSPVITNAIYEGLKNIGFNGGEVLEPSMGVGNFFGTMPDEMRANSNLSGVEIDSISGRIAQKLYPEASIAINGFEKVKPSKSTFDLAVGNVPFGNHGVADKTKAYKGLLIHDYFFAKSLDSVRPGGVVAFVTSTGTLDKEDTKVRQMLAQKAELMGAVRLPNNAFQKNAGTQTSTDIIFLKKREKPLNIGDMAMDKSSDWVHTKENKDGYKVNSYFADNPQMVLGELSDKGRFGSIVCTPIQGADLKEQLHEAMKNIKGEYTPLEFQAELDERAEEKYLTATPDIENLTYAVVEDKLYFRVNDSLIPLKESEQHGVIADRRKAMCDLGVTVRELLQAQVEDRPDMEIKLLQAELNTKYDKFVLKFGRINPIESTNQQTGSTSRKNANKTAFKNDVRLPLLQSLEKMKEGQYIGKTEIFTERTIRPRQVAEHVDTAQEALILSVSEKGKIDFGYMEQLTGLDKNKLINDLHGDIFPVPELSTPENTVYQTSDEYLSGNIYKKIAQAEEKIAENPVYAENVAALTQVIPPPLKATEIDMQLGMTWIDPKIIQQFMYETFDTPQRFREYDENIPQTNSSAITVTFSGAGKGSWKIDNARFDNSVKSTKNFGTKDFNAYELLEKILNSKSVAVTQTVKDYDTGKNKTVILEKQTKAAEDKVKQINSAFKKWIFADPERRNELVKTYNEKFNCIRPREYDGSNLNFFGSNPEITLKPHQKNAVAHALFGGNTLFAHQVGAGKTFEMIATAMEGKRLGLHNKSMFVVPNHLTEQIGSDFMKLYPNANILVAKPDDFSPQKRRQMCARIATGNFDAVIIGHSQLIKIPLSPKREEEFIRNQINEVVSSLEAAKETDSKSYTVKQLEATKAKLRERLEKLTNSTVKDSTVTFEELGIDKLFVDEAHEFKNLYVSTKMENVSGLSTNADVQKTQDLYLKCQYLDEITGGKGIVFSTGTPVTNALSEMFTMQKYLQSDLLKESGLDSFDSWAGNFTRKTTETEISPSGSDWRMKTRLKFTNVPELVTMFKECADIKMADQLNLDVPECSKNIVSVEPTESQKAVVESLAERAERISQGGVSRTEDNMLVVTGDGRKLGLDQRLFDLSLPDEPQTKLNACVKNVYDIWESTADKKSTQLIFCDLGVPQSKEDLKKNGVRFDVYADIKKKLLEKGIPEKEIAFIHEAETEVAKAKLFAKVRSGDVRVLIGSTQKMGAGTNVQDKLIALHDLDCPWRPADLTQRLGRMVRQGNENDRVHNYRYVTKGTFDAYLYQMVEKKQESIAQIFTSKAIARTCDDIDDMAVDFMQVKMAAVGDDRIRRQMELKEDIRNLNMLRNTYLENRYELEDNIKELPKKIEKAEKTVEGIAEDIKMIKSYVPHLDIDGKETVQMKVGGEMISGKKEAAQAFTSAMTKAIAKNPTKATEIAEYKGFKIAVSYDPFTRVHKGLLKGAVDYPFELGSSESGNMTRIENVIASVPRRTDIVCNDIEKMKTELADSLKEVNMPFEHEAELSEKKQELERLTEEINADKINGKIAPEQPESTVAESEEKAETPDNQTSPTDVKSENREQSEQSESTAVQSEEKKDVPENIGSRDLPTENNSEQQEPQEQPEKLNIKWKQNGKEMRITFDINSENKVTSYVDGKENGHCKPDELVVSRISESEQKNFPAEITKCVKPLNLAFSSKMAMHIRTFAEKVKNAYKQFSSRETSMFSRDKIMTDEFKPVSNKEEKTQTKQQAHSQ